MSKKALVIGGTGHLGSAVSGELLHAGWEVTVAARGIKPHLSGQTQFIRVDRSVQGELLAATRGREFDLVVDCVAHKPQDVAEAIESFGDRTNHYVFISTDFVYAFDGQYRYPITEQHATQRDTAYSRGKLEAEDLLVNAWEEKNFPATILRPPHLLGAGKELGCDPALGRNPRLLDIIRSQQGLVLIEGGQLLVQPVWNPEVGRCIVHFFGNPNTFGRRFHCTSVDCVTTLGYYELIAEYLGVPLQFESVRINEVLEKKPDFYHHIRHRMYDSSHLTAVTGYIPKLRLTDAIAETAEWMLQKSFSDG